VSERRSASAEQRAAPRTAHRVGSLRLDLRRDPQAPAIARSAVDAWCPELEGGQPRLETLLLLVSEIVTNAVMHSRAPADAPIVLTAGITGQNVGVAVIDGGEGFAPPDRHMPRASDRMTIGGYGLYVVDRAASRWGVDREGGTRVWFEL
jgi:serine/threonine-protein kinase RsbW